MERPYSEGRARALRTHFLSTTMFFGGEYLFCLCWAGVVAGHEDAGEVGEAAEGGKEDEGGLHGAEIPTAEEDRYQSGDSVEHLPVEELA